METLKKGWFDTKILSFWLNSNILYPTAKKNERYYKIHRLMVYGRCICNGQAEVCSGDFGHLPSCQNCENGRIGNNCERCPNFTNIQGRVSVVISS